MKISPSVPTIQTVNGQVVFFRKGREKSPLLNPRPSGFLPLPFRRRKRGTGFDNPAPRFRPFYSNGKTVCTTAAAAGRSCGASAPAPPASPKEQDGWQGLLYTYPTRKAALDRHGPRTRPFSQPVRLSPKRKRDNK